MCALILVALASAELRSARQGAQLREQFLKRMDAALSAHDPQAILALSDVGAWTRAGYTAPEPQQLRLPEGPLTRVRDLSETDVLYKDVRGRQWRLSMACAEDGTWRAVIHDRACPRGGGMERDPRFGTPPAGGRGAPATWTPLECYPLPL